MKNPQDLRIEDYSYLLPEDRIAKFPLPQRDASKLLVYDRGQISEDVFGSLPSFLHGGLLLVMNNTKVIPARLLFHKGTGAAIEVFCLSPFSPSEHASALTSTGHCAWDCMVGNARKWKQGQVLEMPVRVGPASFVLRASRRDWGERTSVVDFSWDAPGVTWADILDADGVLPIPPYLKRETQESDKVSYQTVYSKVKGSVAAPTAGLHFTNRVFDALDALGVQRQELTLHVGAGTFQPVKSETLQGHDMHTEVISVPRSVIAALLSHLGGVVAVGTTSVRTLESLYFMGRRLFFNPSLSGEGLDVDQWEPYEALPQQQREPTTEQALRALLAYMDSRHLDYLRGQTKIIIAPGYSFRVVRAMITNFHQPQNTLMLLVAAFVGDDWRRIYDYALSHNFRFLSYGDSSLLMPSGLD